MSKLTLQHFLISVAYQLPASDFIAKIAEHLNQSTGVDDDNPDDGLTCFNQEEILQIVRILILLNRFDLALIVSSSNKIATPTECQQHLYLHELQTLYQLIQTNTVLRQQIDFKLWPASIDALTRFHNLDCLPMHGRADFLNAMQRTNSEWIENHATLRYMMNDMETNRSLLSSTDDQQLLNSVKLSPKNSIVQNAILHNPHFSQAQHRFNKISAIPALAALLPSDISLPILFKQSNQQFKKNLNSHWQPGLLFVTFLTHDIAKAHALLSILPLQMQADLCFFTYRTYGIAALHMLESFFEQPEITRLLPDNQQIFIAKLQNISKSTDAIPLPKIIVENILKYLPDEKRSQFRKGYFKPAYEPLPYLADGVRVTKTEIKFLCQELHHSINQLCDSVIPSSVKVTSRVVSYALLIFFPLLIASLIISIHARSAALSRIFICLGSISLVALLFIAWMMGNLRGHLTILETDLLSNNTKFQAKQILNSLEILNTILDTLNKQPTFQFELRAQTKIISSQLLKIEDTIKLIDQYSAGSPTAPISIKLDELPFNLSKHHSSFVFPNWKRNQALDKTTGFFHNLSQANYASLYENEAINAALSPFWKKSKESNSNCFSALTSHQHDHKITIV